MVAVGASGISWKRGDAGRRTDDAERADVAPLPVAVEFNQLTEATLVSTSAAGKQNGKHEATR